MAFGETVDASTAKVILKMLEAGMRKRVVAELGRDIGVDRQARSTAR